MYFAVVDNTSTIPGVTSQPTWRFLYANNMAEITYFTCAAMCSTNKSKQFIKLHKLQQGIKLYGVPVFYILSLIPPQIKSLKNTSITLEGGVMKKRDSTWQRTEPEL